MDNKKSTSSTSLPAYARLPINRCNLPAVILGSLTFQQHPTALFIDGVLDLHKDLFRRMNSLGNQEHRAHCFMDYMTVHFRLESLMDAGFDKGLRYDRSRADYLRVLRGWSFDSDSRDGAVLKGWVESRFGLLPRYHKGPIKNCEEKNYGNYIHACATGLYNTNALEAQLDLLYTYCQYELNQLYPNVSHLVLYRGINSLETHEILYKADSTNIVVILNNLNSFSGSKDRADEFGDYILETSIPLAKILCFSNLLPGKLQSEEEYAVIGGVYQLRVSDY
jgi:NAD+--dinitrogen-reductase ADP-D-ribosyltransferase